MGVGEDAQVGGVTPTPPIVWLTATYRMGEAERVIEIRWEWDTPGVDVIEQLIRVLGADARTDDDTVTVAGLDSATIPDDWAV